MDYEEMILAIQDSESDDCHNCPYKTKCMNQCEEITANRNLEEVYPQLFNSYGV